MRGQSVTVSCASLPNTLLLPVCVFLAQANRGSAPSRVSSGACVRAGDWSTLTEERASTRGTRRRARRRRPLSRSPRCCCQCLLPAARQPSQSAKPSSTPTRASEESVPWPGESIRCPAPLPPHHAKAVHVPAREDSGTSDRALVAVHRRPRVAQGQRTHTIQCVGPAMALSLAHPAPRAPSFPRLLRGTTGNFEPTAPSEKK